MIGRITGSFLAAMAVLLTGTAWAAPADATRTPTTPAVVLALQQPPVAAPAQAGGDGYEPVSSLPSTRETLPAAPMVMGAYAFVWLAVVVYLWSIWRRLGAVERELSGVARRVDDLQRR